MILLSSCTTDVQFESEYEIYYGDLDRDPAQPWVKLPEDILKELQTPCDEPNCWECKRGEFGPSFWLATKTDAAMVNMILPGISKMAGWKKNISLRPTKY